MKNIQLYNEDNLEVMKRLPDESIDVICIDPPYLYLKNQKLERPFNEQLFFSECKRLLTKKGFIIMFGRGTSFYRWNTILDNLGFIFKEEIIWNKSHCTSPVINLSRVHETISIFAKNKGTINLVKVPYLEMKAHDLDSIISDVKRVRTILNNTTSLDAVMEFLKNNTYQNKNEIVSESIQKDVNEKKIIRTDFADDYFSRHGVTNSKLKKHNRCASVMQSICFGLKEKTIIKQVRDHYSTIHPTQKPVRLIERLLALVIPKDKERKDIVVADWFGGSMSTMEAVNNMNMQGISTEIDEEYFQAGKNRIQKLFENKQEKLAI